MIDYKFGVTLDHINTDYAEQLFLWRNDRRVYQWCRQYEPLMYCKHLRWIEGLPGRDDVKMYAVFCHDILCGVCGLTDIDYVNRRAEFSLYIDPEQHGRGLGRKTLLTLFSHGFKALNLNRIWGETFAGNPAFDLFIKIGMTCEGERIDYYYRDGRYINARLISIGRDDFYANLASAK
jgi:RimJ/RimL family protein N-acetyltransferase